MNGEKNKKHCDDGDKSDSPVVLPPEIEIAQPTEIKPILCRWCSSPLQVRVKKGVCPTCKGHQNWFLNYLSQILLVVSLCISIFLAGISAVSVYLTKSNLDVSEQALNISQSASNEALKAKAVALEAQSVLEDLSLIADANTAAVGAIQDINALRKLRAMSRDTNDKIKGIAKKLLRPIIDQLQTDHMLINLDYWGFKDKHDPEYYGFNKNEMKHWGKNEYIKNYMKVPDDRRVVYVLQFLSDENETEEDKINFCHSAFQMESRPDVIYELCAFINERAKLNKDYLFETDHYLTWLKERNTQPNNSADPKGRSAD